MNPTISVIIPVYGVEAYLQKCVDSVLSQDERDFEILLIDDGSPDGSGALCDRLAKTDSRIRVFHNENHGLAYSRNFGMQKAKGTYFCFVDSDDYVQPDMLSFLLNKAEDSHADVVMTGFLLETPGGASRRVSHEDCVLSSETQDALLPELKRLHLIDTCVGKLYRADFIQKNNLTMPVGEVFEDTAFNLSALLHEHTMVYYDRCFYHYIQRTGSLTKRYDPQKKEWLLKRYKLLCTVCRDAAFCSLYYLKSVFSCLMDLYLPGSRLSGREIKAVVRQTLSEPSFSACAKSAKGQGMSEKMICLAARTGSAFLIRLFCYGASFLKYRCVGLFMKVK